MRSLVSSLMAVVMTILMVAPASALPPPPPVESIDTEPPEGGDPAPPVEMEQDSECATSHILPGSTFSGTIPASDAFDIDTLSKFGDGEGVTVAVIDSGVNPNVRLPRLIDGGDYVNADTGLSDCDHHGSIIAGIIAAQPSDSDNFRGVAPGTTILSIRQTSSAFKPANHEDRDKGASSLATAAAGIVRAVNMGATVINASVTACYPASEVHDTNDLAAALKYARERNVVVVTAAGNADADGCESNPSGENAFPGDPRNWIRSSHVSMPSYYENLVISVGGSTLDGGPYLNTMAGPWVHVAAPAVNITSINPGESTGTLVNATKKGDGETIPINGTSFSTAYVSGLVALMQQRYPGITPDEVKARLMRTAQSGSSSTINLVGYGVVDPVRALTDTVDLTIPENPVIYAQNAPVPQTPDLSQSMQMIVAIIIVVTLVAVGVLALIITTLWSSGTSLSSIDTRSMTAREIREAKRKIRSNSRKARREETARRREFRKKMKRK